MGQTWQKWDWGSFSHFFATFWTLFPHVRPWAIFLFSAKFSNFCISACFPFYTRPPRCQHLVKVSWKRMHLCSKQYDGAESGALQHCRPNRQRCNPQFESQIAGDLKPRATALVLIFIAKMFAYVAQGVSGGHMQGCPLEKCTGELLRTFVPS